MECPRCGKPLLRGKPYCMYCGCRAAAVQPSGEAETDALFAGAPEKLPRSLLLARLTPLFLLIGMLLFAGGGYAYVRHFHAQTLAAMRAQSFDAADAALRHIPAADYLYPAERVYVNAGLLMEEGGYDHAAAAFTALGGYEDAAACVSEARYRKAAALGASGDHEAAASIYRDLGAYRDSAQLALGAAYDQAMALSRSGDPAGALSILRALDAGGYKRAGNGVEQLLANVYAEAETLYARGAFDAARKALLLLGDYQRSYDYLALIEFRQGLSGESAAESVALTLVPRIGFADADALLLLDTETACAFLAGRWSNAADAIKVTAGPDGGWNITCSLPWSATGTFRFANADLLVTDRTGAESMAFHFTVRAADCVTVYAAASETAYVFYRE